MRRIVLLPVVLVVAACNGEVFVDGDGGDAAVADSPAQNDAPAVLDCYGTLCSADDVCMHPCCGGANVCTSLDDGGTCPSGTQESQTCPPQMPCSNVCVPDPPYCAPRSQCPDAQGNDCFLVCA